MTRISFKMEFPPEIVGMIREYSKPVFKYFKEYNDILHVLNLTVWKDLKDKLRGSNADEVAITVRTYVDSVMHARELRLEYAITLTQTDDKKLKAWVSAVEQTIKNYSNIPARDPYAPCPCIECIKCDRMFKTPGEWCV